LDIEKDKATRADKIYIAQSDNFDQRVLRNKVKELEKIANTINEKELVAKIKEIISL